MRSLAVLAGAVFVVVLAAVPRIACLGCQSLWLDEILTAEAARETTFGGALAVAASWIDQAPLDYVLTWALSALGPGEFAIRLPYAIAGILAALSMYGLASSLFGRFSGLVAGFLMAVLPYAVYYSQDANASILLILPTTLLVHATYRAVTRQRCSNGWCSPSSAVLRYTSVISLSRRSLPRIRTSRWSWSATWIGARRGSGDPAAANSVVRPILGVTAAAIAIAVSFLPWASNFVAFLGRRDVSFARVAGDQAATPDKILALLAQLDLQGPTLALFVAGVVYVLVRSASGRWREGAVALIFLVVPVTGFLVIAGPGIVNIWSRYLSIVYPPIVLLVALGIVGLAEAMVVVWRRLSASAVEGQTSLAIRASVAIPLVILICVSALTAVGAAQQRPKGSDYRGAVDRMLEADPARPVVLVTGPNAAWVERGLIYYGWARGSGLRVIDALSMDLHSLDDLRAATSVWLATRRMDMSEVGFGTTRSDHTDFALFDSGATDGGGVSAARDLLASVGASEPGVARSARLIDAIEGDGPAGEELLPAPTTSVVGTGSLAPERWTLQPDVTLAPDGSGFVASPARGEANAILVTEKLRPGADYLLDFGCRTTDLRGALRAWVIATDAAGTKTYLDGSGERCRTDPGAGQSVIAFTVPDGAVLVTVQLQTTGSGTADIGPISLHPLS